MLFFASLSDYTLDNKLAFLFGLVLLSTIQIVCHRYAGCQDAAYSMYVFFLNPAPPHQTSTSGTRWSSSWARPRQSSWRSCSPQWGTMLRTGQSTQASPSPSSSLTAFSPLTLSTTNSKVRNSKWRRWTVFQLFYQLAVTTFMRHCPACNCTLSMCPSFYRLIIWI